MSRRAAWGVMVVALAAIPFATWWLVGDLSEVGGSDYMFRTPEFIDDHSNLIGSVAMLVVVASLAVVLSPAGRRAFQTRDRVVAALLAFLGMVLATAYRTMTAAVGGANIGGGLAIMFLPVFIPAILVTAIVQYRRIPPN